MNKINEPIFPCILKDNEWCNIIDFDKKKIKKISIVRNIKNSNDIDTSILWDISAKQNLGITASLCKKETEIIICSNGSEKISANISMKRMFADFVSLEKLEGLGEMLDTSNVDDMSYLFYHCTSLKKIDLSKWNVSNVTNFRGTFCCGNNYVGDARLKYINLSNWDFSSAKDMAYMFYGCGNLKQLDVSKWNVSNVTNFRHTFADCFKIKKLDVRGWDTHSAITLDGIFNDCRSIKEIDISNWDTSSCKEFDQLFDNCISLKKIKGLDKINTTKGISFEQMFFGCKNIKKLDLSSLDTRKVDGSFFTAYESSIQSYSNMNKIFVGCNKLNNIKLGPYFVNTNTINNSHPLLTKLDKYGYVIVCPKTGSMRPMIRQGMDKVVFKAKENFKKNDIVLFDSEFCSDLVMHRIKRVLPQGYIIRGDNAKLSEFVFKDKVYAVATEIYKDNKIISCNSYMFIIISFISQVFDDFYLLYKNNNSLIWKIIRIIIRLLRKTRSSI